MRKIIFIFTLSILAVFIPKFTSAALDADTVWELRADATASNVNGGGFNSTNAAPGTDYSQQTAAEDSGADLASVDGDAVPCVVTSATHNFVAADNGNIIHITAAGTTFTVGWYEIVSTSGNAATLDRACGVNGANSGGTWYLGGAMSLNSTLDDDFFEIMDDGMKIWVKNGSYTIGETVTIAAAGGTQKPIVIEGYNSARGDDPTGSNRPTFAAGAATFTFSGANWDIYNVIWTGTAGAVLALAATSDNDKLINVKVVNSSTTVDRNAFQLSGAGLFIFNCEGISYQGRALRTVAIGGAIIGCYLHDSDVGYSSSATTATTFLFNNIIESNKTAAIQFTAAVTGLTQIINNTLYGSENTTGIGVHMSVTGATNIRLLNNIIYGFATGVSHFDSQTVGYDNYNDYFNNDTDVSNWTKGESDQALNPQFTNVAQVTGTTATYAGATLTDAAASFANVADNQDFVYIVSGTGMTAGQYLITAHTATTITTSPDAGENVAADVVYQVTTGRNFAIGTNLKALGFPGLFQAGLTTGYMDIGAVQRKEGAGAGTVSPRGGVRVR